MAEINVPISITYHTTGVTPIADVIAALQAADAAIQDAISLLPSFSPGLQIEYSQVNVRVLSQESPLREILLVTLLATFQHDLTAEIPPMLEDIFKIKIPDSYDSLVTVVTMIVLFYGAAFLKDAATKATEDGALRHQLRSLIRELSKQTNRTEEEIKKILDAKYGKPSTVKSIARIVRGFFLPSQREGGVPITFDRDVVHSDVIREIPNPNEFSEDNDFERYEPYNNVILDIHAQDRDKTSTGWAAVANGITDKRIKVRLVEPVTTADIWNRDRVNADITIVSKLTAYGYIPCEIQITRINN